MDDSVWLHLTAVIKFACLLVRHSVTVNYESPDGLISQWGDQREVAEDRSHSTTVFFPQTRAHTPVHFDNLSHLINVLLS